MAVLAWLTKRQPGLIGARNVAHLKSYTYTVSTHHREMAASRFGASGSVLEIMSFEERRVLLGHIY